VHALQNTDIADFQDTDVSCFVSCLLFRLSSLVSHLFVPSKDLDHTDIDDTVARVSCLVSRLLCLVSHTHVQDTDDLEHTDLDAARVSCPVSHTDFHDTDPDDLVSRSWLVSHLSYPVSAVILTDLEQVLSLCQRFSDFARHAPFVACLCHQ
jgi:hypothetical protein